MINLVVIYCLSSGPEQCVENRMPIDSPLPMACMVAGQQAAQEYVREHPKYRLVRWKCEIDVPRQVPA
jgi:hypothetical protein